MSAVAPSYYRIDPAKMKAARHAAMLTQCELSQVSGVSYNSIQRIEQGGKRTPLGQRASTVKCLAKALVISPVDILCMDSPQGQPPGQSPGTGGGTAVGTSHVMPSEDLELDLGVDLEPHTPNAVGKGLSPQAAPNTLKGLRQSRPSPFAIDDHQQGLLVRLWEQRPEWASGQGALTYGGLVALMKKHGAGAVNDALEDLSDCAFEIEGSPHAWLDHVAGVAAAIS